MDPFTALGLAGNIVQFIDFSCKLLSSGHAIHQSLRGASENNLNLELVTSQLSKLANDMSTTNSADQDLMDLVTKCKDMAGEMLQVLGDLRVQGKKTKWKSFALAFKEMRGENRLQDMTTRLERVQRVLMLKLLDSMRDGQSKISQAIANLNQEHEKLNAERNQQLELLRNDVLNAISQLQPEAPVRDPTMVVDDYLESFRDLKPIDPAILDEMSTKLQNLATSMTELRNEVRTVETQHAILKDLAFYEQGFREEAIAEAHAKTFGWIFADEPPEDFPTTNFANWLRSGSGTYWISGKAASGKSTLMKYLSSHEQTEAALATWAGDKKLVTASFYFWNSGTELQKSQEGLLRSLLFEILRKCPRLIESISRDLANRPTDGPQTWGRSSLRKLLGIFKSHGNVSTKFCLFIDGLDEFEGDHDELIDLIEDLASCEGIKLCISSRPWNEFIDAFGQDQDRFLKLQDLTRGDIRLYVNSKFGENKRFKILKDNDSRYQDLVEEVIFRADGVFLWVTLVVRSLIRGVTNADGIPKLQQRLRELPRSLEELFLKIFTSIDEIYKKEAAQLFLATLAYPPGLSLVTCSFLSDDTLPPSPSILSQAEIDSCVENMQRRIDAWSKGLLNVKVAQLPTFQCPTAGFLHLTVREFLETQDMRENLRRNAGPNFNPHQALAKACLVHIISIPEYTIQGQLEYLLEHFLWLIGVSGLDEHAHILEIERALQARCPPEQWPATREALMKKAVQMDKGSYIAERLKEEPTLIAPGAFRRSLLDWSINIDLYYIQPPLPLSTIQQLLAAGASLDESFDGLTTWARFLHIWVIQRDGGKSYDSKTKEVLRLFIKSGADLNHELVANAYFRNPDPVWLEERKDYLSSLEELGENRVIKTASQVITEAFPDDASSLLSCAPPPPNSEEKDVMKSEAVKQGITSTVLSWLGRQRE